jgi:hypothetical protein
MREILDIVNEQTEIIPYAFGVITKELSKII